MLCSFSIYDFSLDKSAVDERIKKDILDYITIRIQETPSILSNITPLSPSHGGGNEKKNSLSSNKSSSSMSSPHTSTDGSPQNSLSLAQSRFSQYLTETSNGCFLFVKLVSGIFRYPSICQNLKCKL